MGLFMVVIEKTDVLGVRSFLRNALHFRQNFCAVRAERGKLTDFPRIRKNPLQTGANSAMIPFVNRGACASRLRVGCIAQTRKPDLDNANVGRYHR